MTFEEIDFSKVDSIMISGSKDFAWKEVPKIIFHATVSIKQSDVQSLNYTFRSENFYVLIDEIKTMLNESNAAI